MKRADLTGIVLEILLRRAAGELPQDANSGEMQATQNIYVNVTERLRRGVESSGFLDQLLQSPNDFGGLADLRLAIAEAFEADPAFEKYMDEFAKQVPSELVGSEHVNVSEENELGGLNRPSVSIQNSTIRRSNIAGGDIIHNKKFQFGVGGLAALALLGGGGYTVYSATSHTNTKPPSSPSHGGATASPTIKGSNALSKLPLTAVDNTSTFTLLNGDKVALGVFVGKPQPQPASEGCVVAGESRSMTSWPVFVTLTNRNSSRTLVLNHLELTTVPYNNGGVSIQQTDPAPDGNGCLSGDVPPISAGQSKTFNARMWASSSDPIPRGAGVEASFETPGENYVEKVLVTTTIDGVYPPWGTSYDCRPPGHIMEGPC